MSITACAAFVVMALLCSCENGKPVTDSDTLEPDQLVDALLTDSDEPPTDVEEPDVDNYGMVKVPAGKFTMGCDIHLEDACMMREYPQHAVTLSTFWIDRHEVTVEDFRQCVDAGACANGDDGTPLYNTVATFTGCNYDNQGKDRHPMNCVSWQGAKAYCEWAGKRLPTEAEWEKTARGPYAMKYPWGNEPTPDCDHAVMGNFEVAGSTGCGTGGTWPVESKKAGVSPYGAYDMAGNVWEWVNDWYNPNYYSSSPPNDPPGSPVGDHHVVRGGSWLDGLVYYFRGASRYDFPDSGGKDGGFRCVKDK